MTNQPSQPGQRKSQETKRPENRDQEQPRNQEASQRERNASAQSENEETSQPEQSAPAQPQRSQAGPRQGDATERRERGRGEAGLARRGGAGGQRGGAATGLARQGDGRQPARTAGRRTAIGEVFDPRGATSVALLRLARNWHNAGSIYQAIHAYTQVLIRYPDTGAAHAAVEELLEVAENLEQQGRFHAALNIFNQLEQLA